MNGRHAHPYNPHNEGCTITEWDINRNPILTDIRATATFSCGTTTTGYAPNEMAARLYAIRKHPHALWSAFYTPRHRKLSLTNNPGKSNVRGMTKTFAIGTKIRNRETGKEYTVLAAPYADANGRLRAAAQLWKNGTPTRYTSYLLLADCEEI